jgi:uncharacterized membrane protein YheB (UPF0754 family)
MTFSPLNFVGIELWRMRDQPWGLFGWQGIIPTKAAKMAALCCDLMTTRLFNIQEIFGRLDPKEFSRVMEDALLLMMDKIIQEVAQEYMPRVWESLPMEVKTDVVVMTDQEADQFLTDFMKDMQQHIDDVLDIKKMTVDACVKNRKLVVKVFKECGEKEFIFIRRSGFYFGFLLGLVQMGLWYVYNAAWTLPAAGFIVGFITNYMALKVIFSPLEPIHICGITIHGLFLKRQKEVSETFARVICGDILHVRAMWEAIFTGPLSANFFALLRAHSLVFIDKLIVEIKPIAIAAMGASKFAQMKETIALKVIENLPNVIDHSYTYTQSALDLEREIREKMTGLPCADFEGVLHPAFEEDELTLIVLGGVLGAIVGIIQITTVFAG